MSDKIDEKLTEILAKCEGVLHRYCEYIFPTHHAEEIPTTPSVFVKDEKKVALRLDLVPKDYFFDLERFPYVQKEMEFLLKSLTEVVYPLMKAAHQLPSNTRLIVDPSNTTVLIYDPTNPEWSRSILATADRIGFVWL